jgi:hypothetical protein
MVAVEGEVVAGKLRGVHLKLLSPLSGGDRKRAIREMDRFLENKRYNAQLQRIDVSAVSQRSVWFRILVCNDWSAEVGFRVEGAGSLADIPLRSTAPYLVAELLSDGVSQALGVE